ncbi:MAG: alanine racemase [Pseudomonadota bacterium]
MAPHRPTVAEIDLDAVRFNYEQLRDKVGKEIKILAVVKADGYGHGAAFISKELQSLGVNLFGVGISEEGISLRKAGIKKPIIILNGLFRGQVKKTVEYNLTPVIYDLETAHKLSDEGKRVNKSVKVHVKTDTGMGRVGVLPKDIIPFFTKLRDMANLEVEGILSHLSTADGDSSEDRGYISLQLQRFEECIKNINVLGFNPPLRHIANSAATIDLLPSFCNMLRPGLMLYGAYPSPRLTEKISLKPVMRLKTEVMQVKNVPAGYSISYKRKFITKQDSVIATLPVGYADGYNRLLSNKGSVLIGGEKAPVVGTVCMDMIMVDVTKIPNVNVGDEVVLMGKQGDKEISADEIADKIGTISYEVFCGVSKRVPRIYIKNRKIIGKKSYV